MPDATVALPRRRFLTGSKAREAVASNRAETAKVLSVSERFAQDARAETDRHYLPTLRPIWVRIALKTPGIRGLVNTFAKSCLSRGFETGVINAQQFHAIAGIVDRRLWPERH